METTPPSGSNIAVSPKSKQENPLWNILFNIVVPILILNKGSKYLGSVPALVVALAFPLSYFFYDYVKRKKANAISILGLLNVLVTGSLAIYKIHGLWFAVKEAAFPLLVGCFVFGSAFTKSPFISTLILNRELIDVDLLNAEIAKRNHEADFKELLKKATMLTSLSFLFSAIFNFILARHIFLPIEATLSAEAQSVILNEQIAKMTTWAMVVIALPSMVFLAGILFFLSKRLRNLSGLTEDQLFVKK